MNAGKCSADLAACVHADISRSTEARDPQRLRGVSRILDRHAQRVDRPDGHAVPGCRRTQLTSPAFVRLPDIAPALPRVCIPIRMEWPMLKIIGVLALVALVGCAGRMNGMTDWDLLGSRQVSDRVDHDVIAVGAGRGDYRRIKITVQRASIDFHRVVVHYGNGSDQRLELRNTIPAGGESRAIDLEGNDRVIRSVEFWYDANTIRGRRAQVRVFGMR